MEGAVEGMATVIVANVLSGGTTVEITVPHSTTIGSLKGTISETLYERPAVSDQRLIYCGKICKDGDALRDVLRDLQVPQTLHLVLCRKESSPGAGSSSASAPTTPASAPTTPAPPAAEVRRPASETRPPPPTTTTPTPPRPSPAMQAVAVTATTPRVARAETPAPTPPATTQSSSSQVPPPAHVAPERQQLGGEVLLSVLALQEYHAYASRVYAEALREGNWTTERVLLEASRNAKLPLLNATTTIVLTSGPLRLPLENARLRRALANNDDQWGLMMALPPSLRSIRLNRAALAANLKLALKLALMVLLLGQDGDPTRLAILSLGATVAFLFQSGMVAVFVELCRGPIRQRRGLTPRQSRFRQSVVNTLTGRILREEGIFLDAMILFTSIFLSLAPTWRPTADPLPPVQQQAARQSPPSPPPPPTTPPPHPREQEQEQPAAAA